METLMRVFAAAIAISFLGMPLSVQPSRAEEPSYPWCASYNTDSGNHGACGYYTYEQCMSYVSGLQGTCSRNPFYAAVRPSAPPRPRHAR